MISLTAFFWIMVMFFALIGSMRGWTKEVIATSGLILSLFAINQFGPYFTSLMGGGGTIDTDAIRRQVFYLFTGIHLVIAFFSYQGPAFAGSRLAERLRVRDSLQDKLMGLLVGGVNGYLIIGAILAFLEYQLQSPAIGYVWPQVYRIRFLGSFGQPIWRPCSPTYRFRCWRLTCLSWL